MPRKLHTLATKRQSWVISRYQEGICLNPKEYILDGDDGEVMEFDSVQESKYDFPTTNLHHKQGHDGLVAGDI